MYSSSKIARVISVGLFTFFLATIFMIILPVKETHAATISGYKAKGYIFLREPGPFGLGHVGFGYEYRTYYSDGTFRAVHVFGAVENPNGKPYVTPGDSNGGWYSTGSYSSMMSAMRGHGYSYYKYSANFFATTSGREANAYGIASNVAWRGYTLATNNCMNAAYDVLVALGTPNLRSASNVPDWSPRWWFWNGNTTGWSSGIRL